MNIAPQTLSEKIIIIGAGKVGQSLTQLLRRCHYDVCLLGRDFASSKELISDAKLILITTNDDVIKEVCDDVSAYLKQGAVVSHCSGALDSQVLISAKEKGCFISSSHPLNTFPNLAASLKTFANTDHGSYLYCEGDPAALSSLMPIFTSLGFTTVELNSNAKTAYHAACVFACNYLTVLMEMSLQTANLANIDQEQFWRGINPLIYATLNNISEQGTVKSLSGPIARGDHTTVQRHIDYLSDNNSDLADDYLTLAKQALQLAEKQGSLSKEKHAALEEILNG